MVKFRSWNKEQEKFIYFVNGAYLVDVKEVKNEWLASVIISHSFNWQKAEMFTGYRSSVLADIFENDIFLFYDEKGIEHKGLINFINGAFYFIEEGKKHILFTDALVVSGFNRVVGNTHKE